MNFKKLKELTERPNLYEKGSSVMWTDPHISKQLLKLHINPDHDIASRNQTKIEKISNWILEQIELPQMEILDMGCGPGLYAELLSQKGHQVTGIDFSQTSIDYAREQAKQKKRDIAYVQKNYLDLDYSSQFDLAIMIYLDFCALTPEERDIVLQNVHRALKPGGWFIFDTVNELDVEQKIISKSWDVQETGFWKAEPYIALVDGHHFPEAKVWANHHVIMDENGNVDSYIFWNHYYQPEDLKNILGKNGFSNIEHFDHLSEGNHDFSIEKGVSFFKAQRK